ncbi:MAG: class I SAM-dependent methyltransferase [Bdellovibrionaceae bacterium]|nr:class I SAM-dependent methyltransferase [Pseudobdellovibrionaceae bacterium]NUM60484.1 methyltransferase domain-containing protein [Pseudobdellovibrionaceae bacterium]
MHMVKDIKSMSYTDFVGFVNQTNVPPGSFDTITRWLVNSFVDVNSHIVEIACTTGFSVSEISKIAHCTGEGVDISTLSVTSAIQNNLNNKNLVFHVQDATQFKPHKKATHVVVGAALGFFPDPQKMINQLISFFDNEGYILASPFYVNGQIPQQLLQEAEQVLGITPTQISYKQVMNLYKDFQITYENRSHIVQETDEEISHYCKSTIERAAELRSIRDENTLKIMYDRLYQIRDVTNRLRPFQEYSVLILRYKKNEFGKRFVELF